MLTLEHILFIGTLKKYNGNLDYTLINRTGCRYLCVRVCGVGWGLLLCT